MRLRILNLKFVLTVISALYLSQGVFSATAAAAFNCSNFDMLAYYGGGVVNGRTYKPEPHSGLWKFSISEDCTKLITNHEAFATETLIDGNYHLVSSKVFHDNNTNENVVVSETFQKCAWASDENIECDGYVEYKESAKRDAFKTTTIFSEDSIVVEQSNSSFKFFPATCDNNPRSQFCR